MRNRLMRVDLQTGCSAKQHWTFAIWTNTFGKLDKYIWQFGQIYLVIRTNAFGNSDKCIWQFGQVHLAIWTNTFGKLDKYMLETIEKSIKIEEKSSRLMRVDLQTGCSAKQHWTLRLDRDTASRTGTLPFLPFIFLLSSKDVLIHAY